MLSFKDFEAKQIIIIQTPDELNTKIKFQNDNLVYIKDNGDEDRISCYRLLAIFLIGDCSLTTVLLRKLTKFGASIFLLNRNLENYSSIESKAEANYLLRMHQYAREDELGMAKNLIKNKISNQSTLLKNNVSSKNAPEAAKILDDKIPKIDAITDEKVLLGIEGSTSNLFFQNYFAELGWFRRLPRAKIDEINLLLDLGYTVLLNFIDCLLRLYGFDVYKGFYHKLFFKRKSLSCDMAEPVRALVDQALLKAFHLKQINKKDFTVRHGLYCLDYKMADKYLKIFCKAILRRKEDLFNYIHNFYIFMMSDSRPMIAMPFFKI